MSAALAEARHGTDAGYKWHKRHGEQPCPACLAAHADRVPARLRICVPRVPRPSLKLATDTWPGRP